MNKFVVSEHPRIPQPVKVWATALASVNRANMPANNWGYWVPEPHILVGPESALRVQNYLRNWFWVRDASYYMLAHRPSDLILCLRSCGASGCNTMLRRSRNKARIYPTKVICPKLVQATFPRCTPTTTGQGDFLLVYPVLPVASIRPNLPADRVGGIGSSVWSRVLGA